MTHVHSMRRLLLSFVQQNLIFSTPLNIACLDDKLSSQRECELVLLTYNLDVVQEMFRLHRATVPAIFILPKLIRRLSRDAVIAECEADWAVNSWAMALGLIPFSDKSLASIYEEKSKNN